MAQSLAKVWIHLIFLTKDRTPFLKDRRRVLSKPIKLG